MSEPRSEPADEVASPVPASASNKPDKPSAADGSGVQSPTDGDDPDSQRSRRRVVGWSMLVAGIVILLAIGWVSVRSVQAYRDLAAARNTVTAIQQEFDAHGISRPVELTSLAHRLAGQTAGARSAVDDPLYRVAAALPGIGPNLEAVRTIALSVDGIAAALTTGADLAGSLDEQHLFPHDGAVDMNTVTTAAGVMHSMNIAVQQSVEAIDRIDTGSLLRPLADQVVSLRHQLTRVAPLTATGDRLGSLVVPMLGADGPRRYLVVFQNPAESRATGGIFGSYALLGVQHGAVRLMRTGSVSRDIGSFDPPLAGIDPSLTSLYSPLLGIYPQDVNFTPDFPSAARLIARMYQSRFGGTLDGVIASDPLVVGVLLQGQPPIDLGNGIELTTGSAPELLMSGIYARYPTSQQTAQRDALLAKATGAAFAAIASNTGPGAFRPIISGIKDMVDQRRVLVWSAHPNEEQQILPTAVSGRVPVDALGSPTVGVFLNDGTGGKLDYYLTMDARLGPGRCASGGGSPSAPAAPPARSARSPLSVTLSFDAPTSGLPNYVISGGNVNRSVYRLQTNVAMLAPNGGTVTAVSVDGRPVAVQQGMDHGRAVTMTTVVMTPGQTVRIRATVSYPIGRSDTVTPRLIATPLPTTPTVATEEFGACSAH